MKYFKETCRIKKKIQAIMFKKEIRPDFAKGLKY